VKDFAIKIQGDTENGYHLNLNTTSLPKQPFAFFPFLQRFSPD